MGNIECALLLGIQHFHIDFSVNHQHKKYTLDTRDIGYLNKNLPPESFYEEKKKLFFFITIKLPVKSILIN